MTSDPRFLTAGVLSSTSGQVDIDLKTGSIVIQSPSGGTVVSNIESGDVVARIEGKQEVQPLRMGKVTFYGEAARHIRDAQEILQNARARQLEVVKRANEAGEPCVVVDGQVFINAGAFELGKVDAAISVRTATLENGLNVMAGLLSESSLSEQLAKEITAISAGRSLADQVRQVLRKELKPGGMLHSR